MVLQGHKKILDQHDYDQKRDKMPRKLRLRLDNSARFIWLCVGVLDHKIDIRALKKVKDKHEAIESVPQGYF